MRLDKAEQGIKAVKQRLNIDETTFLNLEDDDAAAVDIVVTQRSSITPFSNNNNTVSFMGENNINNNNSSSSSSSNSSIFNSASTPRQGLSSMDLFGGINEGTASDSNSSTQGTSAKSFAASNLGANTAAPGSASSKSGSKMKRRASTTAAAVPLLLPAGSVLDEDAKAIIAELEDWDKEKDKFDAEIAELELAVLRANKKLHKLKLSKKQ